MQKYDYYHSASPPDYESHSGERYDTLIKTFVYTADLVEIFQNNMGDTISYSCSSDPKADYIDCIIHAENKTITDIQYINDGVHSSRLHEGSGYSRKFNISRLDYIKAGNIFRAEQTGIGIKDILTRFDVKLGEWGHYWEEKTEYTLLNTTDSSRIVLHS